MSPRDFSTVYRREPIASAELRATLTGNVWHVARCPFCRRPHDYAAGSLEGRPASSRIRLSLCPRARSANAPGGVVSEGPATVGGPLTPLFGFGSRPAGWKVQFVRRAQREAGESRATVRELIAAAPWENLK